MEVSILRYSLIATGILGIISALLCFGFIFFKMKINHVLKKLLLFATIQQAIGYSTFLCSLILFGYGFGNKLTCFLGRAQPDRTRQDRTGPDRTGQDRTEPDGTILLDLKKVSEYRSSTPFFLTETCQEGGGGLKLPPLVVSSEIGIKMNNAPNTGLLRWIARL